MAVPSAAPDADKSTDEKQPSPKQPQVADVLHANLGIIQKAVASKEARLLFGRVLRTTASVRGQFTTSALKSFISQTLPEDSKVRDFILQHLQGGDAVRFDHAWEQGNGTSGARVVKGSRRQLCSTPTAGTLQTYVILRRIWKMLTLKQIKTQQRSLGHPSQKRSSTACSCCASFCVIKRNGARYCSLHGPICP